MVFIECYNSFIVAYVCVDWLDFVVEVVGKFEVVGYEFDVILYEGFIFVYVFVRDVEEVSNMFERFFEFGIRSIFSIFNCFVVVYV